MDIRYVRNCVAAMRLKFDQRREQLRFVSLTDPVSLFAASPISVGRPHDSGEINVINVMSSLFTTYLFTTVHKLYKNPSF